MRQKTVGWSHLQERCARCDAFQYVLYTGPLSGWIEARHSRLDFRHTYFGSTTVLKTCHHSTGVRATVFKHSCYCLHISLAWWFHDLLLECKLLANCYNLGRNQFWALSVFAAFAIRLIKRMIDLNNSFPLAFSVGTLQFDQISSPSDNQT
jgi:hypothetical protein